MRGTIGPVACDLQTYRQCQEVIFLLTTEMTEAAAPTGIDAETLKMTLGTIKEFVANAYCHAALT